MQAHEMADFVRRDGTAAFAEDGRVGRGVLVQRDIAAGAKAADARQAASGRMGHVRAEHHDEIGAVFHAQLFGERGIDDAAFVLVVGDLGFLEADEPQHDAGSAAAVDLVGHGHDVANARVRVVVVEFGEAAVVEGQHIHLHRARRGVGVLGIGAGQPFVDVAHAVAVRIGQVVEVADVERRRRQGDRLGQANVIQMSPIVAAPFLQSQHELVPAVCVQAARHVELPLVAGSLQHRIGRRDRIEGHGGDGHGVIPRQRLVFPVGADFHAQVAAFAVEAEAARRQGHSRAGLGGLQAAGTLQVDALLGERRTRPHAHADAKGRHGTPAPRRHQRASKAPRSSARSHGSSVARPGRSGPPGRTM